MRKLQPRNKHKRKTDINIGAVVLITTVILLFIALTLLIAGQNAPYNNTWEVVL